MSVTTKPAAYVSRNDDEGLAFIAEQLAGPLPYRWRLKGVANKARRPYPEGTRGQFVAYITARDVMNRLDEALGWANWRTHVRETSDGSVIVGLEIRVGEEWIAREDVGYPNNPGNDDELEPLKAAASDGIKRAAVQFGIGRFLYEIPAVWTGIDASGEPLKPIKAGSSRVIELSSTGQSVDPETGEIAEPPQTPDDAPCAIEDCKGICQGKWVDYNLRKYGVPLCARHGALAKTGDLGFEIGHALDRIEIERADDAKSLGKKPAPQDPAKSEFDWTKFWPLAKGHGIADAAAYEKLTGRKAIDLGPYEALDLLLQKLPGLKS